MWKGAFASLKNIAINTKIIPRRNPAETSFFCNSINSAMVEKLVVPIKPYIIEIPYNKSPEARHPKIKYFNPASLDFGDLVLIAESK